MKKILFLISILFIPVFVLADVTYETGVKKANEYVYNFSDYARYLYVTGNLNYGFNGKKAIANPDFKTGGFLTRKEIEITSKNGPTYLAPGVQYWLMKDGSNKYTIDSIERKQTDNNYTSGVRVTEYILHNTKVTGLGTITTPWEFVDGYKVRIGVSDETIGSINPAQGMDHVQNDQELDFHIITDISNSMIDPSGCEYEATRKNVDYHYDETTRVITLKNINNNFSCIVNFRIGCHKVTFNNNGGNANTGMSNKIFYFKYGKGWFTDTGCVSPLTETTFTKPTRTGHTFKGYKYTEHDNEHAITDNVPKIVADYRSTFIDQDITAKADWEPITYTITLDNKDATTNGTGTIYQKYSVGWYSNSAATASINKITSPQRTDYTFAGYYDSGVVINKDGDIKASKTKYTTNKTISPTWCRNCAGVSHGTCTLSINDTNGNCSYNTVCDTGYSVNNNGQYNATCTATPYTITYELNGGTNPSNAKTSYTIENEYTLPTPTKTDYYFGGWYTSSDFSGTAVTKIAKGSTGNKKFYAKWDGKVFTITLNNKDATTNGTAKIYEKYTKGWYSDSGATTSISKITAPKRTDYTFAGYYDSGAVVDKDGNIKAGNTKYTANKTLSPTWCHNCIQPSHGSCSLSIDSSGNCNYSTSCNSGYKHSSGQNTYNPTCVLDKVTVTVNGALGETIRYSGTSSGTIKLDNTGKKTGVQLDAGSYTFKSSVASALGSTSGTYSKTVTINSSTTTVNVYPDGAIYWYGNGSVSGSSLYSKCGGISWQYSYGDGAYTYSTNGTANSITNIDANRIKIQLNSIYVYVPSGGGAYYSQASCKNSTSRGSYTTAKVYVNGGETFSRWQQERGKWRRRYATNTVTFAGMTVSGESDFTEGAHVFSKSSISGSVNFTIKYDTNLVHNGATIYAFWLQ